MPLAAPRVGDELSRGRVVLFWTQCVSGGNCIENTAKAVPNVLKLEYDLMADGRQLPRPVNHGLVRTRPPPGIRLDPKKRLLVIIVPRAGRGPGIGGFKAQSEIGVALNAGRPLLPRGILAGPCAWADNRRYVRDR